MAQLQKIKQLKPFLAPRRPIFIDPDTGRTITAKTRPELIQKIVTYRAQNELEPIENLNLVLENYWCCLPENKPVCEEVTLKRGWLGYLKGGLTLIKTMLYNNFVPQEEADRRANICVNCPQNIKDIEKSPAIAWSDDIAEHVIGERKSKYHDELGNCRVCSCLLKAKVWYTDEPGLSKEEVSLLPSFCWQHPNNWKPVK